MLARRLVSVAVALLCAPVCVLAFAGVEAGAAVSHEFLPEVSKKITEGVPAASGAPVPGPLSTASALTVDGGHVWVAEYMNGGPFYGGTRVDEFDGSSGVFLPPQLNEEAGVSGLEHGVAVGRVGGEQQVYVGAKGETGNVVAVFDGAGKLQRAWSGANTPAGSFSEVTGVAVDHSAAPSETSGNLYVATRNRNGSPVVDVFKPEVAGVEPGKAAVKQLEGTCASPGLCPGEVVPFTSPSAVAVSGFNSDVLVADHVKEGFTTESESVVDVFEPTVLGEFAFVRQLTGTPTGPEGAEAPFESVVSVAVDSSDGDIYVADRGLHVVDEFDREGKYLGHLLGTPAGSFHVLNSVAVDRESHDVYVAVHDEETNRGAVDVFDKNVVLPDVTTTAASGMSVSAEGTIGMRLNGTVNPDNAGEASCRFVWGTTRAFGHETACEPEHVPDGGAPVGVHATITGLVSGTTYYYRLQASNGNGLNPGEEQQDVEVLTLGPGLRSESVSGVSSTSGTLEATIDPNNAPTTYYFEYGTSTAYGSQVPVAPGAPLGSTPGPVEVDRHVQGLTAGTVYHYRVLAVSELEVGPGEVRPVSFAGPDQTFITQGVGGAFVLPDARQWELVSPPDKHGAFIRPILEGPVQASASGDAMTYGASLPTEAGVSGFYGDLQVFSTRSATGWSSKDISLPHAAATGQIVGGGGEYRSFSEDLSDGLVEQKGTFGSLAPEVFPADSEATPYLRHDATCASMPGHCFEPLLTGAPGYADVPEGTKFAGNNGLLGAEFVGGSPDLTHAILKSGVALTETPTSSSELYEWSAGKPASEEVQLVSVLPKNAGPSSTPAFLGFSVGSSGSNTRHAVSEDGSRIVWSEEAGHLYLRDVVMRQTVQLDVPLQACVASGECGDGQVGARFQIASADGSRVFFTDTQRLTGNAGLTHSFGGNNTADLYECAIVEIAGELRCELTDLTPPASSGEVADVQGGVVGASEDGSWVYFVSNGILGDGASHGATQGDCRNSSVTTAGECNLYVWHDGVTRFVTVLSGKDYPDWDGFDGGVVLGGLTARVSPDGRWLAFMSNRGLTGYDTRDAVSGQPDEEVYLYRADTGGSGIVCASCDPTGARPVGVEYKKLDTELVGGPRVWSDAQGIAANIPGFTPYLLNTALYQSRYLSDEGRLFFNSSDALVSQDINGNEDVYEFEPAGVGDCSVSSTTFSEHAGGCVGLVSSGRAVGESAFMDASETGNDVFFLTGERLVSQDVDTSLDLYDAHACSTALPCANVPVASPACTTADACRSAPLQQPGVFGSPSSATFSGAGNVTQSGVATVRSRSLTRAQKLARALNACQKKKGKRKRGVCKRRARKRYGAKGAGKASATKKGRG